MVLSEMGKLHVCNQVPCFYYNYNIIIMHPREGSNNCEGRKWSEKKGDIFIIISEDVLVKK